MSSNTDSRTIILTAITDVAPEFDVSSVDAGRPLRDEVDLDSLDVLRLLGLIEERTGGSFPVAAHADRASLDELVRLIEQQTDR